MCVRKNHDSTNRKRQIKNLAEKEQQAFLFVNNIYVEWPKIRTFCLKIVAHGK